MSGKVLQLIFHLCFRLVVEVCSKDFGDRTPRHLLSILLWRESLNLTVPYPNGFKTYDQNELGGDLNNHSPILNDRLGPRSLEEHSWTQNLVLTLAASIFDRRQDTLTTL